MNEERNECEMCGTCCENGGPALHLEDADLIKNGDLPFDKLITIRKGELVFKPNEDAPKAASCELIKIAGTSRAWQCFFFDEKDKKCMIYTSRPLSCRTLECWNTKAVEELVEKDALCRFDLIDEKEPIYKMIREHEAQCPCPDFMQLQKNITAKELSSLESLENQVNEDIRIRTTAVQKLKITLAEELFFFGRPLFQLLQQIGIKVKEEDGRLRLRQPN